MGAGGIPKLIKSFKVLSSHKFQVTLTKPANQLWFEYNGLIDFLPLPKKAWDKYPTHMNKELAYLAKNGNSVKFFNVVDGAFKMKSAVQNSAWTFVPNPKYDGHKAQIKRFIFQYQTSDSSEFNALKTGTVQVGYLPASMYASSKQLPNDRLVPGYTFMFERTMLNFKNPTVGKLLRMLPVRQAMEYGIDQKGIIRTLYHGLGTLGTNPVPSHPATFLNPALTKQVYPFNPAKGKTILEKAGFKMVGGVMQNAAGQKLQFTVQYPSGNTTTTAMAQLMQQDWAQEGIKVSLQPVPFTTLLQYHHQPTKWQVQTGIGWIYGGSYPTGGGMFSSTGGYNFFGYSNSTMNKLINATHLPYASTSGSQKAMNAYEMFAAKHLPALWMPLAAGLNEYSKTVVGLRKYQNNFTGSLSPQYWRVK